MMEVPFVIKDVVNCNLQFLTNPQDIKRIDNYLDVLRAVCVPYNKTSHEGAHSYLTKEQKFIIIDQLRRIAEKNKDFYNHFEINYNKHRIGPTIGVRGKNTSFWLRPEIEIKPQKYTNIYENHQRSAQIFIRNRMLDEGVPFREDEDVHKLLADWNPFIEFRKGLMKCFSSADSQTIKKMVLDRFEYKKSN